ncbi:uncharacterized protein LOC143920079 isoform X1 [Arctopsyche grandis]|uniref:uncharacterized protein LOC143920079 isoform X1 n=1 Tax=Arctopsyche grandis TaxID=121162 RepID=UPI00406D9E63
MEHSSSATADASLELSLEQRLKYFATTFITELESILNFHHSILEGTIQKSGKLPEATQITLGMIAGNIVGTDKIVKILSPLLEKPFQVIEKNKSLQYHELVYRYHDSKIEVRRLFVDIAVDVFVSFESQLRGITSQRGPHKAIQRVARDAAERFLNSFKSYVESYSEKKLKRKFQKFWKSTKQTFKPQLPHSKNDLKLNAQKVIEGKSKSQSSIIPDIIWRPGYEIQYKCIEFHKECEKINNDWRTSNLFDEVGVAVKRKHSEDYDVYDRNVSKCNKYGYRRLLPDEILSSEYKRAAKCERTCMHPQYLQCGDFYTSKRTTILEWINDEDGSAVNRRILKFVDQTKIDLKNVKDEVEKQGHENRNHMLMIIDTLIQSMETISSEQNDILKKMANKTDEIKKICQKNLEMTCSGNNDILQHLKIYEKNVSSRLVDIQRNIDSQLDQRDPISFRLTAPVKSFEGRIEELEKIHEALIEKSTAVISQAASIVGLGGVGKTELSKKYAQEYKEYYYNRVFINSEKSETIQNSFKQLAVDIGIRLSVKKQDMNSVVREIYSHLKKNGKTLVVFDNVEEYKDIKPFIFNGSSNDGIHTLITSRSQKWNIGEKGDIKVISLNKFTVKEAVTYLSKHLKNEDEANLISLNNLLDGLPLAIWQVVGYINQQNEYNTIWKASKIFKVEDYVQLYKDQWAVLLTKSPDGEDNVYEKTIATTWTITMKKFEQIGECGVFALSVLKIISYLAPDNIDFEEIFSKFEKDKVKLGKALQLLRDYSMVNLEKGIVSIHRLVQRAIQIYLIEKKEDEKFLTEALILLEGSNFQEHIVSVWEHLSNYPPIVEHFYNKSKYGHRRETPMHLLASHRNDAIAMAKICDYVCDCVNFKDATGSFPLHNATEHGNISLDVVKFLVEKGADVNCKDQFNDTPLLNAIKYSDINVVRLLFENGADMNCKNCLDETPLHLAAKIGNEEIVKYLVTKNAKNIKNFENNTPLDVAVFRGHDKIVEILMSNNNDNDNFFHARLKKATRMSDIKNCKEIIQSLKETKPDCFESLFKESAALHNAVKYSNVSVIEYLLRSGMDVDKLD